MRIAIRSTARFSPFLQLSQASLMGRRETSLCDSRLMKLNAFRIAFSRQIRFNAGAQLKGEEEMRKQFAVLAVGCLAVGFMAMLASAQADKAARPSPAAKATCALADGKVITVDYSSPRAKGRKIFGGLVPYGEVWRAGANDASTFVTSADLTVGGKHVPAASYTIFTIPNKDKWT